VNPEPIEAAHARYSTPTVEKQQRSDMERSRYHTLTTISTIPLPHTNRRANLLDPESVNGLLASASFSEARKAKLVEDLDRFYTWKHIPFDKPNSCLVMTPSWLDTLPYRESMFDH